LSNEKGKLPEFSELVSDVNWLSGAHSIATFIWIYPLTDLYLRAFPAVLPRIA
jgi:hypothetical protein